jgi:hypothetical protein
MSNRVQFLRKLDEGVAVKKVNTYLIRECITRIIRSLGSHGAAGSMITDLRTGTGADTVGLNTRNLRVAGSCTYVP